MKILGLPGVKPATRAWLQELLDALGKPSAEVQIQDYSHWPDNGNADMTLEIGRLENVAVDLVIAKSLGTIIATQAYANAGFIPARAVFIGCPLQRHAVDDYALLKNFARSVPTLFIQQTADFNGSFSELDQVVSRYPQARAAEVPGVDHVYGDIDALRQIILPFMPDDES